MKRHDSQVMITTDEDQTLAHDLHGTFATAFWTGTAFLLASAVFQPSIAAISDVFGRRPLLFLCLALFTAGSIICGAAHHFAVLLLGRSIQGIGGGGIITLVQILFADIVPLRQRPRWFSLVLAAWALGTAAGPLLGGMFVQKASFRWAFWINLPFCGIGLVLVFCVFKETALKTSLTKKLHRIDWVGSCFFIFSMTSFLMGLSWGGVQFAWTSYHTLVPVVLGLVGVFVTVLWEVFQASEPFLQRTLFHKWSSIAAYLCAFLQGLMVGCSAAIYWVRYWH
jgi:MFS family permease